MTGSMNPLHPYINIQILLAFLFTNNYGNDKENLFNIWELHKLMIISYNLVTFTFDPRVILQREIRSQPPSGVKGLSYLKKQQSSKLQNTVEPRLLTLGSVTLPGSLLKIWFPLTPFIKSFTTSKLEPLLNCTFCFPRELE